MDMKNSTNIAIVGGVLVVLILGGWWLMQQSGADSPVVNISTGAADTDSSGSGTGTSGGTAVPSAQASGEMIAVGAQAAGVSVQIESMHLTRETWVAVRDGKGWTLGAGRFAAGTTAGTVELLRGTEKGQSYTVVLYADNGNRAFELTGDAMIEGVADTFVAQ